MRRLLIICAALAAVPAAAHAQVQGPPAPPDVDARADDAPAKRGAGTRGAQARLRSTLGREGILRVDPSTGTPGLLLRRDGFLTRRSSLSPRRIVLRYLRRNASAFGLDVEDIGGLKLIRSYTTRGGLTRLDWMQIDDGIPAFDNTLRATVSRGRLLTISGSPKPDLAAPDPKPRLSAAEAVARALGSAGVRSRPRELTRTGPSRRTVLSGRNLAQLVLFDDGPRTRLAWSVIANGGDRGTYRMVIDAGTGAVLKRVGLVARATVFAHDNFPGAAAGGAQSSRDASTAGADPWLTNFTRLQGDNSRVYSDEDDNTHISLDCDSSGCDVVNEGPPAAGQEVPPSTADGADSIWNYAPTTTPGADCPAAGCTWDSATADSWETNREQSATQLFYFVNNFHDHTQNASGIGFTDTQGNFEVDGTGDGVIDGDPVHAQVADGANLDAGLPDDDHLDNANMLTLPEEDSEGVVPTPFRAPLMQMYLFGAGSAHDVNGADDAEIVYHEYTHGLSNRLVDPFGVGGLFSAQGGAMGEAWSDWYALDYLEDQGFEEDSPGAGDLIAGGYENVAFREQSIDCEVGSSASACPAPNAATGSGGFTFGDFGKIFPLDENDDGVPDGEVHADGEIWAQTLWELRGLLIAAHPADGLVRARRLVTDAMRLSPAVPTFLDMRDAILAANTAAGFGDSGIIWDVFARRGMGLCASTTGVDNTRPKQDFREPGQGPCPNPVAGGSGPGTTGAAPTSPTGPLVPAKATFSGFPKTIRVDRRGRFRLRFRGPARVGGDLALRSVSRVRVSARRRVTFANRSFRVPASGRVSILVKLSKRNQKVLRRNRRIRMRLAVVLSSSSGSSRATRSFTLRRR